MEHKIGSGAKAVFSVAEKAGPAAAIMLNHKTPDEKKKLEKRAAVIKNMAGNPERYAEVVNKAVEKVAQYLPNISTGASAASMRAMNYLQSQLPQEPEAFPIPDTYKPSDVQLAKFNTALMVVEKPLSVFESIKHGTLTTDHIQALGAVYPKLYSDMKVAILDHLANHMSQVKHTPYATRINISMFIGQPLDATLTPAGIQAAQMSQTPSQQDQSQNSKPGKADVAALGKLPGLFQMPQQSRAQARMSS